MRPERAAVGNPRERTRHGSSRTGRLRARRHAGLRRRAVLLAAVPEISARQRARVRLPVPEGWLQRPARLRLRPALLLQSRAELRRHAGAARDDRARGDARRTVSLPVLGEQARARLQLCAARQAGIRRVQRLCHRTSGHPSGANSRPTRFPAPARHDRVLRELGRGDQHQPRVRPVLPDRLWQQLHHDRDEPVAVQRLREWTRRLVECKFRRRFLAGDRSDAVTGGRALPAPSARDFPGPARLARRPGRRHQRRVCELPERQRRDRRPRRRLSVPCVPGRNRRVLHSPRTRRALHRL